MRSWSPDEPRHLLHRPEDAVSTPEHMPPGSGEEATEQEREALSRRGLWDDEVSSSQTRYWSWWAVLDAYRAGFADGAR